MNSTPTSPVCPDCGAALPADAPDALCAACLLRQALVSRTLDGDDSRSALPPPSPEEIAGKFPQFEITECLGRGGMGVVYKARQKSLDRWVAIKILAPERLGEETFAARFAREAATLAKLTHPNIVTVHDYGETAGLFYIVMEYIDGVNLRDLLREGKLEPQQALAIVPPICDALQCAHDKGIVHRDIKPENLLLDRDGRIKIADFGIAKLIEPVAAVCDRRTSEDEECQRRSQSAATIHAGTQGYSAPEQANGTTDHRADIYALGVVLYEMLTGERPNKELVAPSKKVQIDVRLDEIVLRALEKTPDLRYQTAGEFKTVVEAMQTVAPPPASAVPVQMRGMFSRWWWAMLVMILVSMLLGLAVGGLWSYIVPKKYEAKAIWEFVPRDGKHRDRDLSVQILDGVVSYGQMMKVGKLLDLGSRWNLADAEVPLVLQQLIQVNFIPNTNFLMICVNFTDPDECCEIANALAAAYVPPATATMIVHDEPIVRYRPVSPNVPLTLMLATAAGLPLGLLLALPLMWLLQRLFPERKDDGAMAAARRARSCLSRFLLVVLAVAVVGGVVVAVISRKSRESRAKPANFVTATPSPAAPGPAHGPAVPKTSKVTVGGGCEVEILGLLRDPRHSTQWFHPDGTPLASAPVEIVDLPDAIPADPKESIAPGNELLLCCRLAVSKPLESIGVGLQIKTVPLREPVGLKVRPKGTREIVMHCVLRDPNLRTADLAVRATFDQEGWLPVGEFDLKETRDRLEGANVRFEPLRFDEARRTSTVQATSKVSMHEHGFRLAFHLKNGSTSYVSVWADSDASKNAGGFCFTREVGSPWGPEVAVITPETIEKIVLERAKPVVGTIKNIHLRASAGGDAAAE